MTGVSIFSSHPIPSHPHSLQKTGKESQLFFDGPDTEWMLASEYGEKEDRPHYIYTTLDGATLDGAAYLSDNFGFL